MPYIKVNVDKIDRYQQNVYNILAKVNTISSDFSNISSQLDFNVKNTSGIEKTLQSIESTFESHKTVLQRTNTFLSRVSLTYLYAENTLYVNNTTGENIGCTNINESPKTVENESINTSTVPPQYSKEEEQEIIALAAAELGIDEADIYENLKQGFSSVEDIAEFIEGKAKTVNKFVKNIGKTIKKVTGSNKVLFTVKDGYVIVSKFTRDSFFNNLVKKYHDGTGLGTRYTVDNIKGTPVVGTIYQVDQIVKKVDKVVDTVTAITTAVTDVMEMCNDITDIWKNDDLSKKEKIIDTTAVVVTSVIGTALDVAAPFAGSAVKTAVTGALSAVPVVGPVIGIAAGYVAGKIVENGMELIADVITSEAVVNQVSDSIEKVGDAVASGVSAVSNANKELMESKNAGEAIVNTAKLVGTAVTAGTKVVATAVAETAKTTAKVVVETAKATVKKVENTVKKAAETVQKAANKVKKLIKKW